MRKYNIEKTLYLETQLFQEEENGVGYDRHVAITGSLTLPFMNARGANKPIFNRLFGKPIAANKFLWGLLGARPSDRKTIKH